MNMGRVALFTDNDIEQEIKQTYQALRPTSLWSLRNTRFERPRMIRGKTLIAEQLAVMCRATTYLRQWIGLLAIGTPPLAFGTPPCVYHIRIEIR